MQILVACSSPPGGGSGISSYSCSLAGALAGLGHQIHYASPRPLDDSLLRRHGMRHVLTDPEEDPLEAMRRVLAHAREHAIEGAINNDNSVLQSLAPGLSAPLVTVCHMDSRTVASLCTLHAAWTDHVVCISNDMQRTMVSRYRLPITKCTIVHNGFTDPGHDGAFAPRDPGRLRLVFAGGWSKNKGGPRVMASLHAHPEVWRRVRLDWFDAVPEDVKRRVAHLPEVRFHGRVPQRDLHALLAGADVLVFGSSREGCPMLMLEAMSHGVLPIAADGEGAMRWLIDSGREGFICHLSDWPRQLAQCVAFLADRPDVVEWMKRAARQRYLADYRAETNAARMLELLSRPTVDRSRPPERWRVVRWHRPAIRTLRDRLRYRVGRLDAFAELTGGL
jgi:glycosyltransferase involved in cell wall biosynthesis